MPRAMTTAQVAIELLHTLDENNLHGFIDTIQMGLVVDFDWEQSYGKESGYKTILQLAVEEDDGEPYVQALLKVGARANHFNVQTGSAAIHTAATEAMPEVFKLLLQNPENRADINVVDKDGLTAFHILLAQLIDLANLETRQTLLSDPLTEAAAEANHQQLLPTEEDIDISMVNVMECLILIVKQRDLRPQFNKALTLAVEKSSNVKSKITLRKLCTMTPLQIICSFQTWNAKPITETLHDKLEEIVSILLSKGINPNATGAVKGALVGTVAGSTPAVLLAATRGYYKVIEAFKRDESTDFLCENKFKQTILHIVLKAGYYNKIAVHGEDSGEVNVRTVETLFSDSSPFVQRQMRCIVNRIDSHGNTALHYAKPYPNSEAAKILLANGAKLDKNPQGAINVNPRVLEEHFFEHCIVAEGDDIDDEDFRIRINYKLFEKAQDEPADLGTLRAEKGTAWTVDVPASLMQSGTGKVDTKRLEYFSDINSLHYLLKHPVVASFLEMELNSLRIHYFFDFIVYLAFVIVIFIFLSERYHSEQNADGTKSSQVIYQDLNNGFEITYTFVILCVLIALLVCREFYQMSRLKKRYFTSSENYIEWIVLLLVGVNLIPGHYMSKAGDDHLQRHLAAITLLIAFMQLYVLLVRVVPNTPIPVYINMFTTVLKTYSLILLSYFAYLMSFAYCFYLIFHPTTIQTYNITNSTVSNLTNLTIPALTNVTDDGDPLYGNIGLSLVKTLVTFVGEISYNNLVFTHWLGYVILVLYIFLVMIVLMNVLNGLAVSDIRKIMAEVDTYYHVSIVETLAYTSFVQLLAEEVILFPNVRPESQRICGLAMPGTKVYRAKGGRMNEPEGKKKAFFFREDTVKAAKELVSLKQQQNQSSGEVTLDTVRECVMEVKRDQNNIKLKLTAMEEGIRTIMDIMISRQPVVERM